MRYIFPLIITTLTLATNLLAHDHAIQDGDTGDFQREMETDRPDFTEGTMTVEPGRLQVELGYLFTYNDDPDVEQHSIPQSLFRIGLLDNVELRLGWEGYQDLDEEGITSDGSGDMSVGYKHSLGEFSEVALSYILELSLPVGSDDFTADEVQPAFKFLWATDLDDTYSLAGNINFAVPHESDDWYFEPSASLAVSRPLTDDIGTYIEYFGIYPSSAPESPTTHYFNGGFTYGVTDSLQLDILAGFGVNDSADDFFTGCGVSFRL